MRGFEFANARARALELNILGEERVNRLLDCKEPNDALKILSEVGFGENFSGSALDFEQILTAEKKKLYDFITESCDFLPLKGFLMVKSDYHNAECFIKAKHLGIKVDDFLDIDGLTPKDKLKDYIFTDNYGGLSPFMANALLFCDGEFAYKRATGESISNSMNKAYFKELKSFAKQDKDLLNIYNVKADCVNVGVALRTRDFAVAKDTFVEFGKLGEQELKTLCNEQLELLKEKFSLSYLSEFISYAVDSAIKNKPLSKFERLADSFAVNYVKKDRYATEGIMPFMQYCLYKLNDIANVRIIMVGLINNLEKAEIRKRLRAYYER